MPLFFALTMVFLFKLKNVSAINFCTTLKNQATANKKLSSKKSICAQTALVLLALSAS